MMIKKQIFLLVFILLTGNIYAQITVTDTDIIDVGDVIYQATDSIPGTMITPGNAGANQTWDFSSLNISELDTMIIISPVGTPFEAFHPTANICIEDEDEYIYINKSSSGVNLVGFDDIPYPQLILPLPLNYGMSLSIGPTTAMDTAMANMFLPDSLAIFITMGQAQEVDSIGVQVEIQTDFDVDAYGNVTIPLGTYDALRLKANQITTTNFFAYCTDTLFGTGSGWYPMPSQIFPSEVEIIISYQWWTNNPTLKFALVEMTVDSSGNVEEVLFLTNPGATFIQEQPLLDVTVYPIPSTDFLTIELLDDQNASLKLIDALGKVVLEESFNYTTQLDMSVFAKGIYYLSLKTEEQSVTKKIIVE